MPGVALRECVGFFSSLLKGARRIEAVDINPDAVKNTRMNFARHDIKNGRAFVSDGFSSVRGKFDVIVWNAPFHGSRAADLLERGCADEGYKDVREFFIRVPKFLKSGGRVVLGFSESGDLNLVRRLVRYCGLRVLRELSDWRDGYNCVMLELSFDIRPALPTLDAIA